MTQTARRTYTSPRRQQSAAETRAAVVLAGRELFSERGWSRTSVRDIAARAKVSVETVYSSVGGKLDVLSAANDVGVVGDAAVVPLRDRPEFRAVGEGDWSTRLRAVARMLAGIYDRNAGIHRALAQAAAADERAGEYRGGLLQRQRADVAAGLALALGRTPTATEVDGTWALVAFETYDNLVRVAGWSSRKYQNWLVEVLDRLLDNHDGG